MKVYLNNKEIELENNSTLLFLLEQFNIKRQGIAVAVNNSVISITQCDSYFLNDNDKITIIKAVSGG